MHYIDSKGHKSKLGCNRKGLCAVMKPHNILCNICLIHEIVYWLIHMLQLLGSCNMCICKA